MTLHPAQWSAAMALTLAAGGCSTNYHAPQTTAEAYRTTSPSTMMPDRVSGTFDPATLDLVLESETRARLSTALTVPERQPLVSYYGETPTTNAASDPQAADRMDPMINSMRISYADEGEDFDPCPTPDGTRIVFASTRHRPTADIYVKPVDAYVITQLTTDPAHDVMPAVSPDGGRVAFASNRAGNWDVFVMPIDGGQPVQITSTSDHELHPSWSPNGSQLVFCRLGATSGKWELWVTGAFGNAPSSFIGYGLFPEWCPVAGTGGSGADRIVFQRSRERGDRAFGIWTIDYRDGQTTNPTQIVASPDFACINPSWSPDGTRIVYATVPDPDHWISRRTRPAHADLWMIGIDGTSPVTLTGNRFVNLMPKWAPDNKIYFVSDRGGPDNIWAMGAERPLLAATGHMPDGSAVTQNNGPSAPSIAEVPDNDNP